MNTSLVENSEKLGLTSRYSGVYHPPPPTHTQPPLTLPHTSVCLCVPLELLTPTGLGASGSRWTLQSMGMSLEVGTMYSCPPQTLHGINTNSILCSCPPQTLHGINTNNILYSCPPQTLHGINTNNILCSCPPQTLHGINTNNILCSCPPQTLHGINTNNILYSCPPQTLHVLNNTNNILHSCPQETLHVLNNTNNPRSNPYHLLSGSEQVIITIKRISRAPIFRIRWEYRANQRKQAAGSKQGLL